MYIFIFYMHRLATFPVISTLGIVLLQDVLPYYLMMTQNDTSYCCLT